MIRLLPCDKSLAPIHSTISYLLMHRGPLNSCLAKGTAHHRFHFTTTNFSVKDIEKMKNRKSGDVLKSSNALTIFYEVGVIQVN